MGGRHGRRGVLIVYGQHWKNDELARCFIEDFPDGRFIHTIRDPISALDSWFDRELEMERFGAQYRPELAPRYLSPAAETIKKLLRWDRAHEGMEARTRAIRFEDLHLAPSTTMRRLADWLGIPYQPSLLESTFNGLPYYVRSGGVSWVGANPDNARRRSKNLNSIDRLLVFTLLQENFARWRYPMPGALRPRWQRLCIMAVLLPLPVKMEAINARLVLAQQALSSLRKGRFGFACGPLLFLLERRLRIMLFLAWQTRLRLGGGRQVVQVL